MGQSRSAAMLAAKRSASVAPEESEEAIACRQAMTHSMKQRANITSSLKLGYQCPPPPTEINEVLKNVMQLVALPVVLTGTDA